MTTETETAEQSTNGTGQPLLSVEDLRVSFRTDDGVVHAVDGISYALEAGKTLGIVGESGSGKTVSSLTTLGLTRLQGARVSGRILFEGRDLVSLPEADLRAIRGKEIAMVFQDPLSSPHPLYKVGSQLVEAERSRLRPKRLLPFPASVRPLRWRARRSWLRVRKTALPPPRCRRR